MLVFAILWQKQKTGEEGGGNWEGESMRMCDGLSEERTEDASWDASLAKQAPRWGLYVRNESQAEPQVKV